MCCHKLCCAFLSPPQRLLSSLLMSDPTGASAAAATPSGDDQSAASYPPGASRPGSAVRRGSIVDVGSESGGDVGGTGSAVFVKTLQSDVSESMAFTLLMDVATNTPNSDLAWFDEDDLDRLSRYLSVLSFNTGDQIISKGEPASFCGIVLDGMFEAVLGDAHRVPLPKASLVGGQQQHPHTGHCSIAQHFALTELIATVLSRTCVRRDGLFRGRQAYRRHRGRRGECGGRDLV